MPDELYSIAFDYLTKGGKPMVLQSPPQLISAAGGGASGGMKSAIIAAVVSSVLGGVFRGFARTRGVKPQIKSKVTRPKPAEVKKPTDNKDYSELSKRQADLIKENQELRKNKAIMEEQFKKSLRSKIESTQGQRAMQQQTAHVDKLKMEQVTKASVGMKYDLPAAPTVKGPVAIPEVMLPKPTFTVPTLQVPKTSASQVSVGAAKQGEPLQYEGTGNAGLQRADAIQRQSGLNEVTQ